MGLYVKYCKMEGNRGITGIAVIETSHIAIHVWDGTMYFNADRRLFLC